MSVFKIAKISGAFDSCGALEVCVVAPETRGPFSVNVCQRAGSFHFQFSLTPDQSRDLRAALEDAEAKAEILTAAI
jgi:hypothetical protein